ncbi:MAG: hypothetical protein JWN63_2182 [Candidatus Acidoferrum typicum]|nr:hypothetical protein [Candidatus Acidoferrum typicum]
MSFYKTLQGLDLTTGQGSEAPDNLEDALGRMIDPDTLRRCFGCHTTAAVTNMGFDSSRLMPGVNCEACHGPGAKHAALMDEEKTEQGRQAIFNPSRLNPVALVDFCVLVIAPGMTSMSWVRRASRTHASNPIAWRTAAAGVTVTHAWLASPVTTRTSNLSTRQERMTRSV